MAEFTNNPYGFKEAVTIDAERIFDSCSDRDCLEDLDVVFSDAESSQLIDDAQYVKARCVEIAGVYFQIEPIPFNCGFYAIDLTYSFNITFDVSDGSSALQTVVGTATFTKKVILFGSDGGTKYFTSDDNGLLNMTNCMSSPNLPKASVSVADPIVLNVKLVSIPAHNCCADPCCESTVTIPARKHLSITIGLFSIISLSRKVPVMLPAFNYDVPKDCSCNGNGSCTTESPCELFEKITFPTSEFFPKSLEDVANGCNCGCCNNTATC